MVKEPNKFSLSQQVERRLYLTMTEIEELYMVSLTGHDQYSTLGMLTFEELGA